MEPFPCHAMICFHPVSLIQGGLETLWGDLTFCHQPDYVSRRFNPPPLAHTSACHCIGPFVFFPLSLWVSEKWTTRIQTQEN